MHGLRRQPCPRGQKRGIAEVDVDHEASALQKSAVIQVVDIHRVSAAPPWRPEPNSTSFNQRPRAARLGAGSSIRDAALARRRRPRTCAIVLRRVGRRGVACSRHGSAERRCRGRCGQPSRLRLPEWPVCERRRTPRERSKLHFGERRSRPRNGGRCRRRRHGWRRDDRRACCVRRQRRRPEGAASTRAPTFVDGRRTFDDSSSSIAMRTSCRSMTRDSSAYPQSSTPSQMTLIILGTPPLRAWTASVTSRGNVIGAAVAARLRRWLMYCSVSCRRRAVEVIADRHALPQLFERRSLQGVA